MSVWIIRGGEGNRLVDDMVDHSYTGLGYYELGDAALLPREAVEAAVVAWGKSRAVNWHTNMLWGFIHEIDVGDFVVMPDTARGDVVVGEITGEYRYDGSVAAERYRHRRPVHWIARHAISELPVDDQSLHRQRPAFTRRQSAALDEHLRRVVGGEIGRAPLDRRPIGARTLRSIEKAGSEASEQLCPSCFMRKHPSQFDGDTCSDCG